MDPQASSKRSAYSRKYSINTSAMMNNINNFTPIGEQNSKKSIKDAITKFSIDIARCDYPYSWMSSWNSFLIPLLILLSSFGSGLLSKFQLNSTTKLINNIIQILVQFAPNVSEILINVIINSIVFLLFISYIIYFIYLIIEYRNDRYPSTFELNLWIFLTRCLVPFFSLFFLNLFFSIFSQNKGIIYIIMNLSFSIPLIFFHIVVLYYSNLIWNVTPIFRKKDQSQLWYCYSTFENKLIYLIYLISAFDHILQLTPLEFSVVSFFIIISIISLIFIFYIFRKLPFLLPSPNAFYITIFLTSIYLSAGPMIYYYYSIYSSYFYLFLIFLFPIFYYIGRLLISNKIKSILLHFRSLRPSEEINRDGFGLNLLNPQKENVKIDYDELNLEYPSIVSLYMRIGYMFNNEDVNNLKFVQWSTNSFSQGEVILPACQISYSLQIDMRYMNELQKTAPNISGRTNNLSVFLEIFNELRQELLTQLNKPLLDAVQIAKKSNSLLQQMIGDFWGGVLKQKQESILTLIPQISTLMMTTDKLFQRLIRNYERTPVVLRETTLFYHKSLGDHHKTLEYHANYNKSRKKEQNNDENESDVSSASGIGSQNVDKQFFSRLEPAMAAQDAIQALPSKPMNLLALMMILGLIVLVSVPAVIYIFGINDMMTFSQSFIPIDLFSEILFSVTRIPQLIRRNQLSKLNKILPHDVTVGPPLSTNLEFITGDKILPSIIKYVQILKKDSLLMLTTCKNDQYISSYCSSPNYPRISGSNIKNVTAYDLLSSFINSAEKTIDLSESNWLSLTLNSDAKFLFENFDVLFLALSTILDVASQEIVDKANIYRTKTYYLLIIIWAIPIFLILPLGVYSLYLLESEMKFMLKLFFGLPKNEISTLRWQSKTKKTKQGKKIEFAKNSMQSDGSISNASEFQAQINEQLSDSLATSERLQGGLFFSFALQMCIFCIGSCIMMTIGVLVYSSSMINIVEFASSFTKATDTTSSVVASYVWIQELFSNDSILYNNSYLRKISLNYIDFLYEHFNEFLYHNHEDLSPAILLDDSVIIQYLTSTEISNNVSTDIEPVNSLLHSVYFSLSSDSQIRLLYTISEFLFNQNYINISFTFNDIFVYHYEHLIFSHLEPLLTSGQNLILKMTNEFESKQEVLLSLIFIILFTLQFLYYFSILIRNYLQVKHHFHTSTRLLLLVPDRKSVV